MNNNNIIELEKELKITENCKNILLKNYKVKEDNSKTIIFYDTQTKLSQIIANGYIKALKNEKLDFEYYNFYEFTEEDVKLIIDKLKERDLVVLIQSQSFRMSKYRWRNILYDENLKVIEHAKLINMQDNEKEIETYINSLTYDLDYHKEVINKIKPLLEKSNSIKIVSSDNSVLEYSGKMDKVYENIAFYDDKKNWGSRFPIGEILTESLDLTTLNGDMLLYAFPDLEHKTNIVKPFKCHIENGFLTKHEGPENFNDVFKMIQTEHPENKVYVRELGLGLNRGIKKFEKLGDISSYERLVGLHFSLGMKHGIYEKKLWPKYGKKYYQRYHIDVFVDLKEILVDNIKIYEENKGWIIN